MKTVRVEDDQLQLDHAKIRLHGTADDLLSLVPGPDPAKNEDDPFLILSGRAALAWLALFSHARLHGSWSPRKADPNRPELGGQLELTAHWTVQGLGYAMGTDRVTAGKAVKELVEGGWIRRENLRNKGQFGGMDYTLCVPGGITQGAKRRVAEKLKKRGVEYRGYEWRKASRCLSESEIERVHQDVELEIKTEQADALGFPQQAENLAAKKVVGKWDLE